MSAAFPLPKAKRCSTGYGAMRPASDSCGSVKGIDAEICSFGTIVAPCTREIRWIRARDGSLIAFRSSVSLLFLADAFEANRKKATWLRSSGAD